MMLTDKTFIIAEAGVNHNGSLELAKQLVDVAKEAEVDAIKFQTFNAELLACETAPKAEYQKRDSSESQLTMLKALELTQAEQIELANYCKKKSILFLSSPFDVSSVDFLVEELHVPLIKIPSGEITNLPLLMRIASKNIAVILSTGMCSLGEIELALAILAYGYAHPLNSVTIPAAQAFYYTDSSQEIIKTKVKLLHCTTEYPAPFDEVNLRVMTTLKNAFELPVGYSDHTQGLAVSIAAVACGATIIEKHFTLDKNMKGPDHSASLDPVELKLLVQNIKQVELALGSSKKIPTVSELKNIPIARKSLVSLKKINKGELITEENMGCKRPGLGISALRYYDFKDKFIAGKDYEKDEFIGV